MIMAISGVNHHDLYNMHIYICGKMAGWYVFQYVSHRQSTALLYSMGFRDNAGLRSGKVFYFNIQIYIH